jgi:hypothetical protein
LKNLFFCHLDQEAKRGFEMVFKNFEELNKKGAMPGAFKG